MDQCEMVIREGAGLICIHPDHQQTERTANPGEALPPVPPCWSPPDAEELPVHPEPKP